MGLDAVRVGLTSRYYPPLATEGIARQRGTLAAACAGMGHDIHVVTQGRKQGLYKNGSVTVHQLPTLHLFNPFSCKYPELDGPLTYSQAVCEKLMRIDQQTPLDVVDVPLWMAEGLVSLKHLHRPILVWLQTAIPLIVELQKRKPTAQESALAELERECLARASGLIADSQSILTELGRFYGSALEGKPARVILPGLPALGEKDALRVSRPERDFVEAIVVGRLEQRKGTEVLLDLLPRVLSQEKGLRVRFVGRDNSGADGFLKRTGKTYREYFAANHPELVERVIFEGYVAEERLAQCYFHADLLLAPSLYESFGLVFLEAMRCGLPVIAFAAGGACEVFAGGEEHGGCLVPVGDAASLADAIISLSRDSKKRATLGARALDRFYSAFLADRMAAETLQFYSEFSGPTPAAKSAPARRILQIMEAMDYGDAVSDIARANAKFLAELGEDASIRSLYCEPRVAQCTRKLIPAELEAKDAIIFHYWNYSHLENLIRIFRGPKAMYFHNITPPRFFSPNSSSFHLSEKGYVQLRRIADLFDLIIGDSNYNLQEYGKFLTGPKPCICIHPLVDVEQLLAFSYDRMLYQQLRDGQPVNFLFVGRIARNKGQHRVMQVFDYYYREINRYSRLYLVGNSQSSPGYVKELEALRKELTSGEHILFTGKVSWEALYAYYRAADVFVCASEHEGFCVPIIEAMAYDLPVVALAASVIPETLGNSGLLIHDWDAARVAELINVVLKDRKLKASLLEKQRSILRRHSAEEVRKRLRAVVDFLKKGAWSPLFESVGPVQDYPTSTQ